MSLPTRICEYTFFILLVYTYEQVVCSEHIETEEIEGGRLDKNIQHLEKNISEVCDKLRRLDKMLTEMYKDPPIDGGGECMRLSRSFNQASVDLLNLCTVDKHKVLKSAQDMVERGGPGFMEVDIDEEKIEQRFKWNGDSLNQLHIVRKQAQKHWYDLWHLYSSLP